VSLEEVEVLEMEQVKLVEIELVGTVVGTVKTASMACVLTCLK
jgi:hypothetical protein